MTEKIIIESHKQILHGRVLLTMTTNVKSTYWTPTLGKLVKLIIAKDTTCYTGIEPGQLQTDRLESDVSFQVIGTQFVGPMFYKQSRKEAKTYLLISSCGMSRSLHLHCVRSVQIRNFFWSAFSCIRTEYEYRKIRTRKNSVFGNFSRSVRAGL